VGDGGWAIHSAKGRGGVGYDPITDKRTKTGSRYPGYMKRPSAEKKNRGKGKVNGLMG